METTTAIICSKCGRPITGGVTAIYIGGMPICPLCNIEIQMGNFHAPNQDLISRIEQLEQKVRNLENKTWSLNTNFGHDYSNPE